jgi:dihydropteroate synthase
MPLIVSKTFTNIYIHTYNDFLIPRQPLDTREYSAATAIMAVHHTVSYVVGKNAYSTYRTSTTAGALPLSVALGYGAGALFCISTVWYGTSLDNY